MWLKKMNKGLFIALICILVSACSSSTSNTKPISKEKKAELFLQMGARYLEMGMLKTAKERLEEAERIDSNNAHVHSTLGVLYEKLGRYDDAREQYLDAIDIDAEDVGIKNNYGRFLCERGSVDQGMQLLKQAADMPINNRKWFVYTNMGRCLLRKGQQDEAELNFRQALQVNNSYAPALFEMQKISYRLGKYMSARAFLERYLAVSKHNAQTLWYAVQIEQALGNMEMADFNREKLFNLFPASKEAKQLRTAIQR